MQPPASLQEGKVLLLAEAGSFTGAYIKHSLGLFGIPVISPPGPPRDAFAQLSKEEWGSVIGCIAADVGPALFADLERDARPIPCLFVGYNSGGWFPGPYAWMSPPFASYQIIEALSAMIGPR